MPVVSAGCSPVLVQGDLEETLRYYPDAARILNAKARRLIRENEDRAGRAGDRVPAVLCCAQL